MTQQEQIADLRAKVIALIVLVEGLCATDLSKCENPALVGEEIVKSALRAEKAATDKAGESAYSLQITETISGVSDRATRRAQLLQQKKRQP